MSLVKLNSVPFCELQCLVTDALQLRSNNIANFMGLLNSILEVNLADYLYVGMVYFKPIARVQ